MKTRRALHVIVGILSLIMLACLLAAAVCVVLAVAFPQWSDVPPMLLNTVTNGLRVTAGYLGFAELWYILPLVAYLLPALLLILATILLFSRNKGKMGKYNAGCIIALIAIALLTIFTFVFATDLAMGGDEHVWFPSPINWTSTDMIVRYAALGALVLTVIFVGSALGVKNKKGEQNAVAGAQSDAASQSEQTEQPSPETLEKINRAKRLCEMGALTQEEYQKIENSYLKK